MHLNIRIFLIHLKRDKKQIMQKFLTSGDLQDQNGSIFVMLQEDGRGMQIL